MTESTYPENVSRKQGNVNMTNEEWIKDRAEQICAETWGPDYANFWIDGHSPTFTIVKTALTEAMERQRETDAMFIDNYPRPEMTGETKMWNTRLAEAIRKGCGG